MTKIHKKLNSAKKQKNIEKVCIIRFFFFTFVALN